MRLRTITIVLLALLASSTALTQDRLRMSTTTSTENSGLLKVLLPPFEKQCNCHVDVISVGTGKALKLGETGDVDVVLYTRANWRTSSSLTVTASTGAMLCTTISSSSARRPTLHM